MRCASVLTYLSLAAYAHARAFSADRHAGSTSQPLEEAIVERAVSATADDPAYWLANIAHQGIAAFNSNPSGYTVFRNVKDYGAKGNLPSNFLLIFHSYG